MVAEALSDRGTKDPKALKVAFSQTLAGGASATATLARPSSGKTVVVVSISHIALGGIGVNTKLQFFSDSTAITGLLTPTIQSLGQNGHVNSGYMPDGHFWTAVDEPLGITVTNGSGMSKLCTVDGFLKYFEE